MKRTIFFLFAIVALVFSSCNENEPIVKTFSANFSYTINSDNPLTVVFKNTSTPGVSVVRWDFGDNRVSHETNPTHVYTSAGTYKVTLYGRVNDESDAEVRKEKYITVGDMQPQTDPYENKTPYIVNGYYYVGTLGKKYYLEIHDMSNLLFASPQTLLKEDGFYNLCMTNSEAIKIEKDENYFIWLYRTDEAFVIADLIITREQLKKNGYPTQVLTDESKPNGISIKIEYR